MDSFPIELGAPRFAAGSFWGVEQLFGEVDWVLHHRPCRRVEVWSIPRCLLRQAWCRHSAGPRSDDAQPPGFGDQYHSAIFVHDDDQAAHAAVPREREQNIPQSYGWLGARSAARLAEPGADRGGGGLGRGIELAYVISATSREGLIVPLGKSSPGCGVASRSCSYRSSSWRWPCLRRPRCRRVGQERQWTPSLAHSCRTQRRRANLGRNDG
jgi:hypothetical protein